jgi:ubiquinone/menaquinone biosynthesis C-methylase UbiE
MNPQKEANYIPALNQTWLTPLYDPVLKWGMREETFKRYLVDAVNARPDDILLDLGCGTGTLTMMLKQRQPLAQVIGLDGDPQILEIAKSKASAVSMEIQWEKGLAFDIPYPPETFDRVVSSLMIHHLTSENKVRAFREIYRVLKPGGEAHILDFGQPHGLVMSLISALMARLEEAHDNFRGRIPAMLQQGGFAKIEIPRRFQTIFGELSHYKTVKP